MLPETIVLCVLCYRVSISFISSPALLNGYWHFSANFGVKALVIQLLICSHYSDLWKYLAVETPVSAGLGNVGVEMLNLRLMALMPDHQSIIYNPNFPSPNIALWVRLDLWIQPFRFGCLENGPPRGEAAEAHTLILLSSIWKVRTWLFKLSWSFSLSSAILGED